MIDQLSATADCCQLMPIEASVASVSWPMIEHVTDLSGGMQP